MKFIQRVALSAALSAALVAGAALAKTAPSAPVELNTASASQLESVPGIGVATAKKIIAGRPYASVEELSKAGLSAAQIKSVSSMVKVAGAAPAVAPAPIPAAKTAPASRTKAPAAAAAPSGPADLNSASEKDLEALPGVGAATAKKIIAGRPFASLDDLRRAGVSASTVQKLGGLVSIGGAVAYPSPAVPAAKPAAAPAAAAPAPAPVPAAAPTPAPAPVARPAAVHKTSSVDTPAQTPPVPGMVWVNTATKVYHSAGDRWYGRTKQGKFMTEADAMVAGYRAAHVAAAKTPTTPPPGA